MNLLQRMNWRYGSLILVLFVILGLAGIYLYHYFYSTKPEISLVIGEPYEEMRQRSSVAIDPDLSGKIWYNTQKRMRAYALLTQNMGLLRQSLDFLLFHIIKE
ncbi:hypothetical protein [Xenorhabdus sp. SGI246]|uniref:hypothetical protein n=1 Tax=Xenorhabdus sp. SGI246 TaxID=3158263 RepID=UPI00349FCD36